MLFADAKILLDSCTRTELRDHAFGDTEVSWHKDGHETAGGYFGRTADVWIKLEDGNIIGFEGMEARQLRDCGANGAIFRNDETGPETYVEGQVAPGLTIDDVRQELTTPRKDSLDLLGDEIDRISNEERMCEAERYDTYEDVHGVGD